MGGFIRARDEEGRDWYIDIETKKAMLAIAGGDADDPAISSQSCPHHPMCILERFSSELAIHFNVDHILYCPALECGYVSPRHWQGREIMPTDQNATLLLKHEAFYQKFVKHFVGNGK